MVRAVIGWRIGPIDRLRPRKQQQTTRAEADEVLGEDAHAPSAPYTMPRCRTHQLSPSATGRLQNIPRRNGFGAPSIQRQPWKSASLSTAAVAAGSRQAAVRPALNRDQRW